MSTFGGEHHLLHFFDWHKNHANSKSNLYDYLKHTISPTYIPWLKSQDYNDEDDLIYLYAIGNSYKHVELSNGNSIVKDVFSIAIYENKNSPLAPFGEALLFDPPQTLCTMVVARNPLRINNQDVVVSRSLYVLLKRISSFCEMSLL